ncbi:MAG: hypothetical protein JW955_03070 [Sedimentisphaerales bacterium]|nr:hypothetical protein [Sedimentisphaerales bacterium]
MTENENDFRKLVAGVKIDAEPDPAHRERLRRQMLQTFEGTAGRGVLQFRSPSLSLRILAIAAVVLVAATVGLWAWLGHSGPMTFDQVRLATARMPWLHAVIKGSVNGEARAMQHWYDFAAQKTYVVMDDGSVLGWDCGARREQFVYSPRVKAVVVSELTPASIFGVESAYNLIDAFAVFAARDDVGTTTWTAEYEGKSVRAYGIETSATGFHTGGRPATRVRIAMLADPATKRVVAANVEYRGRSGAMLGREDWAIDYPQSGPASLFDLGVPVTARVIDRRQQPVGTPSDEPAMIPTPAPASSVKLVPLRIKLPRPQFVGTPQDARTPHLEQPRGRPRPPFLAPPATTNLALGKPVSASDRDPLYGTLDMITDGDKEADDGSFIELGPEPQYVTIDLRESCEIYAIVVWHYHRLPRVYFDVVVQISDDKSFRTRVQTVFNNDRDNSLGLGAGTDLHYTETNEGKLIDGKGVHGRYVRLYSNGNTSDGLNHYIEVEVYGRTLRSVRGN